MRGFQSEVDLSMARAGGSSTDASASRAFRNQVSSVVQSLPDDLWGIHPMNQLAWLKYFKDKKPDHGFLSWLDESPALPLGPRYDLIEVAALCPVYLPGGIDPARSIPTYGPANFRTRSRGHFDFGDHPVIRWTCPWWRIRLVTAGSMNLNYVLYASLDHSMVYFPDRINRQYGVIQRVPRVHSFESGPMTQSLLTNLADRWRNRNSWYMGQGVIHDTVTPGYADWFYSE
ncbi:hypothetical protein JCGZ_18555 [Jatropha curcas]|uniref:Aminotransferase-like plant mobile domain-containing protein n=1 Tax=Jatropha curcas TaxID=180498 RepID=A0A067KCW7_JATCU|nr:hypothetical protein JCGZ_18555 [Jatropha curcas]